jgi:4-amino-4-deoxy-L-arabinose transferase-like glycosyltransferase
VMLALWLWGLCGRTAAQAMPARYALRRADVWWMAGLFVAALVLRVVWLERTIPFFIDELHFSDRAREVWAFPNMPLFSQISGLSPFATLYSYWISEVAAVFGRDFFGFRLTSALMGAMTVPALYALARSLFDRRTAILAGVVLLTFPPHLHFSRLALIQIGDALFGVLLVLFLARAWRSGRRMDYALAGVCLGMVQLFYEGGKLFFPLLAMLWLLACALVAWRAQRTAAGDGATAERGWWDARGLAISMLMMVVVVTPFYLATVTQRQELTGRAQSSGLQMNYWNVVWQNINSGKYPLDAANRFVLPYWLYVSRAEEAHYYGGTTPLVLPPLVPLLLLGVGACVALLRAPPADTLARYGAGLLLLWLVLQASSNTMLQQVIVASRYLGVLPPLALLIGLGMRALWLSLGDGVSVGGAASSVVQSKAVRARIWQLWTQWRPQLRGLSWAVRLWGALVLCVVIGQAVYYFAVHVPTFEQTGRIGYDLTDAALRIRDEVSTDTRIYIVETNARITKREIIGMLAFFTDAPYEIESILAQDFTAMRLFTLPQDRPLLFVIGSDEAEAVEILRQTYSVTAINVSPNAALPLQLQMLFYRVSPLVAAP